jgi:hypothetical protein
MAADSGTRAEGRLACAGEEQIQYFAGFAGSAEAKLTSFVPRPR